MLSVMVIAVVQVHFQMTCLKMCLMNWMSCRRPSALQLVVHHSSQVVGYPMAYWVPLEWVVMAGERSQVEVHRLAYVKLVVLPQE